MQLEQQVVSLELAKKLKELGVKQESYFYWARFTTPPEDGQPVYKDVLLRTEESQPQLTEADGVYRYSAFTVAELGEMLPREFMKDRKVYELRSRKNAISWDVGYAKWPKPDDYRIDIEWIQLSQAPKEADARAHMLIYLIENKFITL